MDKSISPVGLKTHRLAADVIGPWGLAALAIGITSPAMGLYALWGPMQVAAGPITPVIFLASLLLVLPTAISYAMLNSRAPSAGAAANWLWKALSPSMGYQAGLAMGAYFLMAAIAQPLIFAVFFRDLLGWLGFQLPEQLSIMLGIVLATIPVAIVTLSGAEASIRTTVRLMIVETLVVIALSVTILVTKSIEPSGISLAPFDPREATQGPSGFWAAMILGAMAFAGFDVISTAAEEAKAPREYIPKAIVLTVVGIAVFWALNSWAFTLSTSHQNVQEYTREGLTAVTPVAEMYWGAGNLIVILTAFTGITAVYISCVQGSSRLLFALARHGLLPEVLGSVRGAKCVPFNAVMVVLIAVVCLDTFTIVVLEKGLAGFTWWANGLVFFAIITFIGVNLANIFYFRRIEPHNFRATPNLIIPLVGMAMNGYLLYAAFISALWSGPLREGKSVIIACVILLSIQAAAVLVVRLRRPQVLQ